MLTYLVAALAGLCVGSFVTTLVDRVPDELPVWSPGPRCPYCDHTLGASDLVPVFSWLWLRGRCRHCEHTITPAYPVVEVITAGLFVAAAARFGNNWILLPLMVAFAGLVAVAMVDFYRYRIPNRILFPVTAVTLVLVVVASLAESVPESIFRAVAGAAIYAGLLGITWLISPKSLGFGDVKLALLMGMIIGLVSPSYLDATRLVLVALILASVLGVLSGGALALARRATKAEIMPDPDLDTVATQTILKTTFPFGPALVAGAISAVLFSERLLAI